MSSQDMPFSKMPIHKPSQTINSPHSHSHNTASQNLSSQSPEAWFVKFFIGSMISISFLTIALSFLPSSSGLRNHNNLKPTSQVSIKLAIA